MELEKSNYIKLIQAQPICVITSTNKDGVCDAETFSWLSPASFDPPMLVVMMSSEKNTLNNIEKNEKFVVNLMTKHFLEELIELGNKDFESNPNKLDESDLTLIDSKEISVPRLEESVAWLECKVEDIAESGDHSVVLGKILGAEVEDEFWDEDRFLPEKAETLHYLGEDKFLVGGEIIESGS